MSGAKHNKLKLINKPMTNTNTTNEQLTINILVFGIYWNWKLEIVNFEI